MTNKVCCAPECKSEAKTIALVISSEGEAHEVAFCRDHLKNLGMDYLIPDLGHFSAQSPVDSYEECRLFATVFSYEPEQFTVILKGKQTQSVFVFPTGYLEAALIYRGASKARGPNPVTHELITTLVQALGGTPLAAVVDGYDRETQAYGCHLFIERGGGTVKVKCRVSDAVAISLYSGMQIRINKAFLGRDLGAGPSSLE